MDKKSNMVLGIVVMLLIAAGLGYWFYISLPTKSQIAATANSPKAVDVNLLKGAVAQKIASRDKNGNVPVVVNSSDVGRDNPFANY